MIGHWLVTAWRSLVSNPLFSAITIISLSIGCCGALLAGSNILQHLSFESHVPEGDRIFVVNMKQPDPMQTIASGPGGQRVQTSVRFEGPGQRSTIMGVVGPMRAAIEGKIPGLEAQTRVFRGGALLKEDQDELDRRRAAGPPPPGEPQQPFAGTIFVEPDFFDVFPQVFVEGSADKLAEPNNILLTESRARKMFGAAAAVGQTVEGSRGSSLTVIGVIKDPPKTTHLIFESVAGLRTLQMIEAAQRAAEEAARPPAPAGGAGGQVTFISIRSSMDAWQPSFGGGHYLKIAEGQDRKLFRDTAVRVMQAAGDEGAKMAQPPPGFPAGITYQGPRFEYNMIPLLDMHLAGREAGVQSSGDVTMLATLAAAAIALLGVSSFNYVTLSLARALRRRREVAIRKVLGGSQTSLVQQYFVESGLVTLVSLLLGFAMAQFLFPWFGRAIGQNETMFDLFSPAFLLWTLGGFVLLVIAVSAYPALYLANVRPRTALGEGGVAAPGRIGQFVTAALMGLQIAAATGLLIVAMTMGAQANYIENRWMGYDRTNKYQFGGNCPLTEQLTSTELNALFQRCNAATKDLVSKTPGIDAAFYFSGSLVSENITTQAYGRSAGGEETGRAARMNVDTDFLQGMGAKLLAGRFFDSKSAFDRQQIDRQAQAQAGPRAPGSPPLPRIEVLPVIITRAALPLVGAKTPEEAIGQRLSLKPTAANPIEVVGVIEDWQMRPLKYSVLPVIFYPFFSNTPVLSIQPDKVDQVREALRAGFREAVSSPTASVTLRALSEQLEFTYQADYRLMRAVSSFALVAIIVAGLGVFGLSAFEMRRRVREIGIRKALGASPFMVAGRVIGRQVAFAAAVSLIAWPIGFYIGNQWLQGFVYRTELGWFVPPVATLVVIAFVAVAVGLSSIRAAAMRPGAALNG